jgi:hypothetical protein
MPGRPFGAGGAPSLAKGIFVLAISACREEYVKTLFGLIN